MLGLLLLGLSIFACTVFACTKEAPREPPPRAQEEQPAPAPKTSAPALAPTAEPEVAPAEPERQDESGSAYDFGAKPAAPTKPAAKVRARPEAPAAGPPRRSDGDHRAKSKEDDSPEALRRELSKAVELSTPDCPAARERKQAICDLAGQLCQLVDRDPDVASVESYCADARQRCSEAERRTAERCPR